MPTTISGWFVLIKDVAIIAMVGWLLYRVEQAGADRVTVKDIAAVKKQLADNEKTNADNEVRRAKADAQHDSDLLAIHALVAARNEPVIVRIPASAGAVSGAPSGAKDKSTGNGGSDAEAGGGTCNVRPAISEYETWVESALADCRQLQAVCQR